MPLAVISDHINSPTYVYDNESANLFAENSETRAKDW